MLGKRERLLLVIADDLGIGPNTTSGILQLAAQGIVTGSTLLVNSPHAADAVKRWRKMGAVPELGWHPNLTLDSPVAPPAQVPSLVRPDGSFWPLQSFLRRWFFGLFDPHDIETELQHQLQRYILLVGYPPTFVNFRQHLALLSPIGEILMRVLGERRVRPYLRRIQEPLSVWRKVPGARLKRALLGILGRRLSSYQYAHGFPGSDWLAGIANPECVEDPEFFRRWLRAMPGDVVELMCHPGRYDPTLIGRACTAEDDLTQQRVNELRWLSEPSFLDTVEAAGFRLVAPSDMMFGSCSLARSA